MRNKAFAYKRVSTQQQTEKFGLVVQENEIIKFAQKQNFEIIEWFADEGISGTEINRNGLQDMLAALENDRTVKYVICLNCSRLWRSDITGGLIRYELSKHHVDIVSVQEPTYSLYTNNASDYLINQIMQALASYDRMQINQKMAQGRRAKAKTGAKPCGSAPIGYKWSDREIEIDVEKSETVIDIFVSFLRLRSLTRLAEYCKEKGYKSLQGNDFSKQALKHILTNDFYVGISTFGGVKSKGTQPVFISIDLFNEVQAIMGRPTI